jgi:hypothetical protein
VFPDQLPAGYVAMLFEAWPQLEYLDREGRGSENYTLPYIVPERHEETDAGTRAAQHGTRAGCPNAVHNAFTTGRGGSRRVISPLGIVRHDIRMLCVLPIDCPLALSFAEAVSLAFFAGTGVSAVNTGPTGNQRSMLDTRGRLEPLVDVLLRQRLGNGQGGWDFKGCSERTLADEPSYWLRRLLAPVEFKWLSGLRLEAPPALPGSLQSSATGYSAIAIVSRQNGDGAAAAVSRSSGTVQQSVTAPGTNAVVSGGNLPSAQGSSRVRQPSYLEVVESSRLFNLGEDGEASATRYTFCLWCTACDCPSTGCFCKHLVAGRIEFRRSGHNEVWSDALLAPITHGRENTLYRTDGRGRVISPLGIVPH